MLECFEGGIGFSIIRLICGEKKFKFGIDLLESKFLESKNK